ncbi:hypothetical protein [Chitinimonas sp.]|uniref:hypothetical protein n=1 Tax=Chitinimonas sp. TaxID=1934313 RepID=UPI0035B1E3D4
MTPEQLEALTINWRNADGEDAVVDAGAAMSRALSEIAATMRKGRLTDESALSIVRDEIGFETGELQTLNDSDLLQVSHAIADAAVLAATGEDRRDAERYRTWRDALVGETAAFQALMEKALPADIGLSRNPTAAEWDKAIDAAIAQQKGGEA